MIKRRKILIIFLAISTLFFSQETIDGLLKTYLGNKNLEFEVEVLFEITEAKKVSAEIDYLGNRYLIITFESPSLLKSIHYCYDLFENTLYTNVKQEVAQYDLISVYTANIPTLLESFLIFLDPSNFDIEILEEENYEVHKYLPKTRNFLKLINVDFTKFNVYYFHPWEEIRLLEMIQIMNSTENKKVSLKIKKIKPIDEKTAICKLENFFTDSSYYSSINSDKE